MATTFADLEARVRGLDARTQRAEEDITAIISTVVETREDVRQLRHEVRWLVRVVGQMAQAQGLNVEPPVYPDESD